MTNIQPTVNAFMHIEDSEARALSETSASGSTVNALTIRHTMQSVHNAPATNNARKSLVSQLGA